VVNRRKPRVQKSAVSRYPAPAPVHDFVLLFLPPCGPHLTPLATGSLKPSLLVSPLLGGPARHRPFALALHLHQRKSSHSLQLQYSAKSQSTPRCQSLTTARSDHLLVLGRSGPQWRSTRARRSPARCRHLHQPRGGASARQRRSICDGKPWDPVSRGSVIDWTPRLRPVVAAAALTP
jgi:hypothetical protein